MNDLPVREHIKHRVNEILRCKIILENYKNNTLKNSNFKEEHLSVIEEAKKTCLNQSILIFNKASAILNRQFNLRNFDEPVELSLNLVYSNEFFEIKDLLNDVLSVYERNFNVLVDRLNINPIDRIRFYKLKFF